MPGKIPVQSQPMDLDWLTAALPVGALGLTLSLVARRYETFPLDQATWWALTRFRP